jgi:outer membrane protein assembly factor BamB
MWRYDAQRSAASPQELPTDLKLHWERRLPRLRPAWPDQPKMQFDTAHEPIVVGQRLFIGSSHDNSVTAYDTRTGEELWTFFTNGPVRFAPAAWEDRIYVASDDGYLYCLQTDQGKLLWRFRGGPSDRQVLGNERLISAWPARGAPVIAEGMVYVAAGIWPFMGIFLHALDARTGEVVWTNDGDGSIYIKQPHNADSFAGVAPQGPLVAIGDKLLIPGGRSVPACYDRGTGRMIHYLLAQNAKRGGGSAVAAAERAYFNGGAAFDLKTGAHLGRVGEHVAFDEDRLYDGDEEKLRVWDLKRAAMERVETIDRKGQKVAVAAWNIDEIGNAGTPHVSALIKAGSRLYVGSEGRLLAFALPLPNDDAEPAWESQIDGTPVSLAAADDRLFAVTREGGLYCFGDAAGSPAPPRTYASDSRPPAEDRASRENAASILETAGIREGYCLAWGAGSGGLIKELARQSDLRIAVIEPDAEIANAFRTRLRQAGVGGDKISVIVADPQQTPLPPYLASLAVAETLPADEELRASLVAKIFAGLRPYGGVACLPLSASEAEELKADLAPHSLANARWKPLGETTLLVREDALPGSADWTHEHADAANTRVSKDSLVKAPLGLLWFGGPTNDAILPRHGHGPQPQVLQGKLLIEGVDLLRAMDIYTGRVLWEAPMPGLGELYNNTAHQPGANASGTNFIATPEGIYVAYRNACWVLDPETGKKLTELQLPPAPGSSEPPRWGYINVYEDYLVGGADPLYHEGLQQSRGDNDNFSSSMRLVVMDRRSGKVLWSVAAQSGFRHNAICLGGGRLFCIDRISGPHLSRLKRRGESPEHKPRLVVFDLATGKELWSTEQDVFGTWLSYSQERNLLVEAGRVASDTLSDEPKGMRVYDAAGGQMLWENRSYSGPAMLHHDTILMAGKACELLTGKPRLREHPLSGESVEWTWSRNYGCNTPAASEHLLTFRSGAAGYFDFCNDGGTGNFGGFRSSCTNNLIVAGGLLTAPDYTRTCSCSYQNQTSLALVPMADVETWTSFGSQSTKAPVRRVGINLGAPGDRKADDGTLWLEFPSVGGSSPEVPIALTPEEPEWFRRHSSQISGTGLSWVAASGAQGLTSLRIELSPDRQPRRYTVRLHFTEPDDVQPGERVFQVKLQGRPAIESLDVVAEAGGRNRALVKEISGVEVARELLIELAPHAAAKQQAAVLSGVEIVAEGW